MLPRTVAGLSFMALIFIPHISLSHGGGLDTYGCHNDRKHGGYHCHRGSVAGQAFSSKAEMLQSLQDGARRSMSPDPHLLDRASPSQPNQVCIRENRTQQIMCGGAASLKC